MRNEKTVQTKLFNTPLKKEDKEFVDRCMEVFNAVRRPKIVMQGCEGMAIPENFKNQIFIERVILAKNGEKTASEAEALWYLSTVSLSGPLSHSWYKIFMYLFRCWCTKTNKELPDFAKEQITLEQYEQYDLKRLRDWLYKNSVEALK